MNQSCHFRGVAPVQLGENCWHCPSLNPLCISFNISILTSPTSLPLCALFCPSPPFLPANFSTKPHLQHKKTAPSNTYTYTHANIHSHLPLCHTHAIHSHPPLPHSSAFPCSLRSPPHPPLPATLLPGRNVFLSLSYTVFTHFPSPSTYSSIPHTLGPADLLRGGGRALGGQ